MSVLPEGADSIAFDDRMPSELLEIPEKMTTTLGEVPLLIPKD